MEQNGLNRRQALGVGAGAIAGAALLPGVASAHDPQLMRRRRPEDLVSRQHIGIQLWTVRDLQAANLPGLIGNLADIDISMGSK